MCPHSEPATFILNQDLANIFFCTHARKSYQHNGYIYTLWTVISASFLADQWKINHELLWQLSLNLRRNEKVHLNPQLAINHSVVTPTYDTYTKPTCNLCVTSVPALTSYQTPTQHYSFSLRSQFRLRTQLLWRLFLLRFDMYYPPLPLSLTRLPSILSQFLSPTWRLKIPPLSPSLPHGVFILYFFCRSAFSSLADI